ncbi:phosphatase PAP2 family protein [candidate division KSB1 bacterium]|nr:phosphatase PAP2 family protein [candidate division KSB1 bacterium]
MKKSIGIKITILVFFLIWIITHLPSPLFSQNTVPDSMRNNPKINSPVAAANTLIHTYVSDSWNILIAPTRMQKKHLAPLAGMVVIGGILYHYDSDIMEAFNRSYANGIYKNIMHTGEIMEPMGQIERMNPYFIGGYLVGYVGKWPKLQTASLQIMESLTIASGYKQLIRELVGRARPSEHKGARFFKFSEGESFPSGHTSNAFQVATILSYHVDRLPFTILSYGIATTVGLKRIDVNLHWASDVFAGAVYGTAVANMLLHLHKRYELSILPYYDANYQQHMVKTIYAFN